MEWKTRPNRWVAVDSAPSTKLTYAPRVNPAPLTVSMPGQNPVTGSLEVVITNATGNTVQVEAITFDIQVGQSADALTPTTAGILTAVSGSGWMVVGPSGVVTDGEATYVLQPQTGITAPLASGSSVIVQIYEFQTVQQPGTTTITVKEVLQNVAPGFNGFQVTTFPTGFYFGALVATVQNGSALVPVAQVATGQGVTLLWSSSVADAGAYTIYYATAAGQQQVTPTLPDEWTSPPLTADTVFTVVVTASVSGGQPQTASLAVPVGVQNPSLVAASLVASGNVQAATATVNGELTAASALVQGELQVNGLLDAGGAATFAQGVEVTGDVGVAGSVGIGTNAPPIAALTVQTGSQQPSANGNASNGLLISAGPPSASLSLGILDTNAAGQQVGWIQTAYSNNAGVVGNLALNPLGGNVSIGSGIPGSTNAPGALVIGSWSIQDDGQGSLNFSMGGNLVAQLTSSGAMFAGGMRVLRHQDPVWINSPGRGAALNASSNMDGGPNGWVATAYWMQGPDGDSNLQIQYGNPFT